MVFRSHLGFNQALLKTFSKVSDGDIALKTVKESASFVIESASSSFKTSDSEYIKSYNYGSIDQVDLVSIDSCTKTITADALRKMIEIYPDRFKEGLDTKASCFIELLKERFCDLYQSY